MSDLEAFVLDIAGNIIGNKLTDVDKERMLEFGVRILVDIKQQLDRIESKLDNQNRRRRNNG